MKIFNKIKDSILTKFSMMDSAIVFFFLGVSLLSRFWMLPNISTHLFRGVPNIYGWMALWNCRVIDTFGFFDYWNTNAMYLFKNNLAFSESMMGFTPFVYPIWKITGNPVLTVNLVSILLLWLSASITYFVLRKLNFERFSAIVGSLLFAFYPWILKMASLGRFHMQGVIWLPIIVYANYKFWQEYKRKYLIILFIFFLWTFLFSLYYGIFLTVFIGIWNLFWFFSEKKRFPLKKIFYWCLTIFLIWLVMLPMLLVYSQVSSEMGLERTLENQVQYTGPAWSWLIPPDENWLWGKILKILPRGFKAYAVENFIFPGLIASMFFVVAMFYRRFPKWLNSLKWSALSIFVFTFGPFLLGLSWKIPMPFTALWAVFYPIRGTRNPHRFAVFVILCLAFLSAYLLNQLIKKKKIPLILQICLIAFIILEFVNIEETKKTIGKSTPLIYSKIKKSKEDLKIVELPMSMKVNLQALTFSSFHWKKILNGTDNYYPPLYGYLEKITKDYFPSDDSIRMLQSFSIDRIIIHEKEYRSSQWTHMLQELKNRKEISYLGRSAGRSIWSLSKGEKFIKFEPEKHIKLSGPSKFIEGKVNVSIDVPGAEKKILFNQRAPFQNQFLASKKWWVTTILDSDKKLEPIYWKASPMFTSNNNRRKISVDLDANSKKLDIIIDIFGDEYRFSYPKELLVKKTKKTNHNLPNFLFLPEGFNEIPFEEITVHLTKKLKLVKGPVGRRWISGTVLLKNPGPFYWSSGEKNGIFLGIEALKNGKKFLFHYLLPHDLYPDDETYINISLPLEGDINPSDLEMNLYGETDKKELIPFSKYKF